MEDLAALVRKHQAKAAIDYCPACGGTKRQRVHITGNDKIDFVPCTTCKGRGFKQKLKSSDYELATQHWRNEF